MSGILGSLGLFYLCLFSYGNGILGMDGQLGGIWSFGMITYTALVVVVNAQVCFEFHYVSVVFSFYSCSILT